MRSVRRPLADPEDVFRFENKTHTTHCSLGRRGNNPGASRVTGRLCNAGPSSSRFSPSARLTRQKYLSTLCHQVKLRWLSHIVSSSSRVQNRWPFLPHGLVYFGFNQRVKESISLEVTNIRADCVRRLFRMS